MHVTKRVHGDLLIDWLIDWLGEWVEWVRWMRWVSEWVRQRQIENTDALHRITPWYLPKVINFICSVALNLRNKCTRVPLCELDHAWRVFFRVRPGPCPSRIHAFSYFTWLVVYNAKTEIRLAGSVLKERFATINLLISIERMAYWYQSNMVCNTNNIC